MTPRQEKTEAGVPVKWLWLAFTIAFLLFVLALFPARLVWYIVAERLPNLQLSGVSGSLWTGSADAAFYRETHLGRLGWLLQPSDLIFARWTNRLDLDGGALPVEGQLGIRADGHIRAENMMGGFSLREVIPLFPQLGNFGNNIQGKVEFKLNALGWNGESLDALDGTLTVESLNIAKAKVGSLNGILSSEEGALVVVFRSPPDSAAGLQGSASLSSEKGYQLDLLTANPEALGEEAGALLKGLGQQSGEGWRISWQGEI